MLQALQLTECVTFDRYILKITDIIWPRIDYS